MCVCMHVYVRVRVGACGRVCVCACGLAYVRVCVPARANIIMHTCMIIVLYYYICGRSVCV